MPDQPHQCECHGRPFIEHNKSLVLQWAPKALECFSTNGFGQISINAKLQTKQFHFNCNFVSTTSSTFPLFVCGIQMSPNSVYPAFDQSLFFLYLCLNCPSIRQLTSSNHHILLTTHPAKSMINIVLWQLTKVLR